MMEKSTSVSAATSSTSKPAIQLYTLENVDDPLPATVERVAAAGFGGVEFAHRFLDADPDALHAALESTGTEPVAAHVPLARLERDAATIVDQCHAVGCRRVVIPHADADSFRSDRDVDRLAERIQGLHDRLEADGIELLYHTGGASFVPTLDQFGLGPFAGVPVPLNGWQTIAGSLGTLRGFDETDVTDRTALARLLDRTADTIPLELDVGWVAAAGYDPVAVLEVLGDRVSLVHVSDVRRTGRFPARWGSAPPGEGVVDIEAVVATAREHDIDWLVFENESDMPPEHAIRRGLLAVTS
jgi:sugar phosphate isomerase/epimerase